ncbi:MAG: hypothetical protein PSV36_15915 [Algoriphagus sp.]|nr:hypothetical protein [Algoriphagus sp.]
MYQPYLPDPLPENWKIGELDEKYGYLEFLGFEGEFLVAVMDQSNDNPSAPFNLFMNQLKGVLHRHDFEKLDWPAWFESEKEAVDSALQLMNWINQNYSDFLPLTLEVLVSVGKEAQLDILRSYYKEGLSIHEYEGEVFVFRKVSLLYGCTEFEESAIKSICHFAQSYNMAIEEVKGGLLTNEKFELIEDLRPKLHFYLKKILA